MNKRFDNIISRFFKCIFTKYFNKYIAFWNLTEKEDTYDNKVQHSLNDFLNF
jgi:hypothetical protein